MTADWVRLPYDLMQRMSTRIINEVRGVNPESFRGRPRLFRHQQQTAKHDRVEVILQTAKIHARIYLLRMTRG
jgi:hypothetical protein